MDNYIKDLPEILHEWYLEAIYKLDPKNYNPEAAKPWNELTDQQKFIDTYIATKLKRVFGIAPTQSAEEE